MNDGASEKKNSIFYVAAAVQKSKENEETT